MAPQTPVIETERLVLREMGPGDLDFLAGLLGDPEVMRFYPRPLDREGARGWIERNMIRYVRDGHAFWLAIDKATGRPVGQAGVVERDLDGERFSEIGYMFARSAWGKGLATEAARACVRWGFEKLGRTCMHALIRPENLPSRRVAERLGMRRGRRVVFAGFVHDLWWVEVGDDSTTSPRRP